MEISEHKSSKYKEWLAVGVMSGTSLDGLDIVLCSIVQSSNKKYKFKILKAKTVDYDTVLKEKLANAHLLNALDFVKLHKFYGQFIGQEVNKFLKGEIKPDIIASHGHTVFHNPNEKLTFQLGDGAFIAAKTKITTISDFRTLDTALGGQGAPLVPIGDKLLFPDFSACLNIGGFANISYTSNKGQRLAFDICPANIITNPIAKSIGLPFDNNGEIGAKGSINTLLLSQLNKLKYYNQTPPKSLGREYVEQNITPLLLLYNLSCPDMLRTLYEHIAQQVSFSINKLPISNVLITGGGAYNSFIINRIQELCKLKIELPNRKIIDFKEALIFALLGVLRLQKKCNCLQSVTGSLVDNCGGVVHIV